METMELLEIGSDSENGYGYGQGSRMPDPSPDEQLTRIQAVLESLLLAAGAPVPIARLVDALQGPGRAEVQKALEGLRAHYERIGSGIRVVYDADRSPRRRREELDRVGADPRRIDVGRGLDDSVVHDRRKGEPDHARTVDLGEEVGDGLGDGVGGRRRRRQQPDALLGERALLQRHGRTLDPGAADVDADDCCTLRLPCGHATPFLRILQAEGSAESRAARRRDDGPGFPWFGRPGPSPAPERSH